VSYEVLGLEKSFQKAFFEYVLSKAYQYAITYGKVCKRLKYVLLEFA
jgi:hypothetical protein